MKKLLVMAIFVGLGVAAYVSPRHAGATPDPTGNRAAGLEIHKANCVKCHGAGGKGDGPAGKLLKTKPADWTDKAKMSKLSDSDLFNVIKNGGAAVGKSKLMPAWKDKLSDQQINDVIAFIRSL